MDVSTEQRYRHFQIFYFLSFFGFGSLFPLLSVYLEQEAGLNHTRIGLIIAMIPIITIFMQPIWGMISDYTRKPRKLLMMAVVMTSISGLIYILADRFIWLTAGMFALALFQSAIVPLSDSLSLDFVYQHKKEYGNIRLWGAVGFAVAVFIAGRMTDWSGYIGWIFIIYATGLMISLIPLRYFPVKGQPVHTAFSKGLTLLFKQKAFMFFLVSNFLVFGPVLANNYYFGTFILAAGGSLSGVGIAFLLAAGSEAPFMRMAQRVIRQTGIVPIMIVCSALSFARWLLYFFEPPVWLIYATTIVQGVSVGLYIPAALMFVKEIAPSDVQATAVGIYSAAGNGLGNAFFSFLAGVMVDVLDVFWMYGTFAWFSLIGIGFSIYVHQLTKHRLNEKRSGYFVT
ncbi:PPP family 3-phenylpropionic acid transporter [Melghiribacillus thermohalophilus]|uniref:PPP family 3-phenylpropionic acid transporter n=1 Tax=Melghiribacillus thermohalophilus TaxID=1324956 RepID=A0A4R3MUV6_9BACI|nr:MFS transporter [Melghiribacillus thermohalophilus]TCT19925.1 PPP family 3-phenylpropionic acid transporter [Melghiribacillus thermohalophilus]